MFNFCNQLSDLNLKEIEYISNLKNVLYNEDFLDDKEYPVRCYYCENEEIKIHYRKEYCEYDNELKELIKGIMPFVKYHDTLTIWYCEDCGSILAIKNYNETKIYYTRFDNEVILEKYLIEKDYIDNEKIVKKCFHCDSDSLTINENSEIYCNKCKEKLGYNYNDKWYLSK